MARQLYQSVPGDPLCELKAIAVNPEQFVLPVNVSCKPCVAPVGCSFGNTPSFPSILQTVQLVTNTVLTPGFYEDCISSFPSYTLTPQGTVTAFRKSCGYNGSCLGCSWNNWKATLCATNDVELDFYVGITGVVTGMSCVSVWNSGLNYLFIGLTPCFSANGRVGTYQIDYCDYSGGPPGPVPEGPFLATVSW